MVLLLAGCSPNLPPEPSFPPTNVTQFTIQSQVLGRPMPALIFIPRGAVNDFLPIVYAFHGFGADETAWFDGHGGDGIHLDGREQALVDARRACPAMIVSAFIGNSYGVDSKPAADQWDHGRYATYIVDELLPAIQARRQGGSAHPTPPPQFVVGVSAGGFAAIHLALTHPDLVSGVGGLSPAMFVDTPPDRQWLFDGDPDANDPMRLVRTADVASERWFLGDGSSDYGWVRDGTAELSKRLVARGVTAPVQTVPGEHNAGTWRQLADPMLEALLSPPCVGS